MTRLSPLILVVLVLAGTITGHVAVTVHAGTINVPADYLTIQAAINAASTGDTVLVAAGTYHELVQLNKTVHLVASSGQTTILDGQGLGTVVTATAQAASISGFTVQGANQGGNAVGLVQVNNVSITGNTISSDLVSSRPSGAGIDLYRSNFTLVDGNLFSHNLYGVNITLSTRNRITNNHMSNSNLIGVEMVDSRRNLFFQNRFENGEEGLDMTGSLTSLNNVTRNVFRGLTFMGVFLLDRPGGGNKFVENTFELNRWGVNEQNVTSGNTFYHNSFLRSGLKHVNHVFPGDGAPDVWDNSTVGGMPWGGNYWDDYTGRDNNGDGIGDTNLRADGVDQYPLMAPFVPVPIAVAKVTASATSGGAPLTVLFQADVLGSLTPFLYSWNFSDRSAIEVSSSPTHTFRSQGNFTVNVTVRDTSGSLDSATVLIHVVPGSSSLGYLPYLVVLATGLGLIGLVYYRRRKKKKREGEEGSGRIERRGTKLRGQFFLDYCLVAGAGGAYPGMWIVP